MLKRTIVIFLCIVIMLSFGACGIKKTIDKKIAEKVTEGVVDKISGGGINIDIDKGQTTIKGDNGEEITIGTSEWPKDKAANFIPEFKQGNVVSVANSENLCMIIVEDVEEEDFKAYVEKLKDEGFINDVTEYLSSVDLIYSASSDDGITIDLLYSPENKNLSITLKPNK